MWICSPREPWHGLCLCHIPQAFLVTAGGCLLSVYLDSRVGLSSTKQRVRSCPWLLALFRLVLNQCRGVFSHPAEWEWMWSGIKLYLTSFFFFFVQWMSWRKKQTVTFSWYSLFTAIHTENWKSWRMALPTSKYLAGSLGFFLFVVSSVSTGKFSCHGL